MRCCGTRIAYIMHAAWRIMLNALSGYGGGKRDGAQRVCCASASRVSRHSGRQLPLSNKRNACAFAARKAQICAMYKRTRGAGMLYNTGLFYFHASRVGACGCCINAAMALRHMSCTLRACSALAFSSSAAAAACARQLQPARIILACAAPPVSRARAAHSHAATLCARLAAAHSACARRAYNITSTCAARIRRHLRCWHLAS